MLTEGTRKKRGARAHGVPYDGERKGQRKRRALEEGKRFVDMDVGICLRSGVHRSIRGMLSLPVSPAIVCMCGLPACPCAVRGISAREGRNDAHSSERGCGARVVCVLGTPTG